MMRDLEEFRKLREAPLWNMGPTEWRGYDPAMAAYLRHDNADVRASAIERLATSVLHWHYGQSAAAEEKNAVLVSRVDWLLREIDLANALHSDVIRSFLHTLRYHGDDPHVAPQILKWLGTLPRQQPQPASLGVIRGTELLVRRKQETTPEMVQTWIALLDDTSNYLRSCAAYRLGETLDDDPPASGFPSIEDVVAIIGRKELQRPGLAGSFWSPRYFPGQEPDQLLSAALWMLDLLERRDQTNLRSGHEHCLSPIGPSPEEGILPFNDIAFYLHELCDTSPALMQRMLDGGFVGLALETALERDHVVDGVKPILESLAASPDTRIAGRARDHLKRHYS